MHVCRYVYTQIHIYTYIHTQTHSYTQISVKFPKLTSLCYSTLLTSDVIVHIQEGVKFTNVVSISEDGSQTDEAIQTNNAAQSEKATLTERVATGPAITAK